MSQYSEPPSITIPSLRPIPGLTGTQSLSFWELFLRRTVPVCLMCLLVSKKQRVHFSLAVLAPCLHDVIFNDRCNISRTALFPTTVFIASLVVGHIVGLESTEDLNCVSS